MEGDLRSFIREVLSRYSDLFGDRFDIFCDLYVELFELAFVRVMHSILPVVVNLMTLSIPRFLFIVSVFNEHKVLNMAEQSELLRMVMESGKLRSDMSDDEFSRLFLEVVDKWKSRRK